MKDKYKRIGREKRSKFWIWFYYWKDRLYRKKKKAKWADVQKKDKPLEDELVDMKKKGAYVADGKVKK